jgi:HlyD family secretion protein
MKIKILIASPLALALVAALVSANGCGFFSKKQTISYDYGTEKVKNEQFIVAFSEGGQLESVSSVKIENEMDGSSTIVSIVDEGSTVKGPRQAQSQPGETPATLAKQHGVTEDALRHVNPELEAAIAKGESITIPGDLLVELDPGSLKDKILNQELAVRTAKNSVTKAQNDLEIQKLRNQQNIEDASINVRFAKLDMEKFKNSDAQLMREDFVGSITNLANQVKESQEQMAISEAKLKWYRELEEKKFLSKMSLREEELNLSKARNTVMKIRHSIMMMRGESDAYEKYVYPKSEQNFASLIKQAELSLTTVQQTATNNMITATTDLDTQKQKLSLEEEQLIEVKDQMNKTRIYAPSPGLVVYHVGESSRYGGSSGPIEKGATLRKGQDIIHLPNLTQMLVSLKVHESRINQVKPGLFVQVRIDTVPDRSFKGEITFVAPVASAAERWGSNKKVFKCEVAIKEQLPPYVRPGASATCRIFVANLPKVREVNGNKVLTLKVPIQSVVTTTEGRRVCFKMDDKGQPLPIPVQTGYYDQTHIQVTEGLAVGDVVLKAPLLHAKELNVGGSLFGYRKLNAEDLGITLPETKLPAQPAPTAAPKGGHETTTPAAVAGKGKGRPGGGSGRSSGPPAELNLTDAQKAKWTAASDKMRTDMRGIFSSGVPREQMGAKMTELRAAFQDELKKFLTTEQLAKYEQTRSQRSPKGKGGGRPDGGGRPGGGSGRGGGMSLTRYDTDGDNKVSKAEFEKISERAREFLGEFSALDTNGDDFIDKTEEAAFIQKMMQRLGGGQ